MSLQRQTIIEGPIPYLGQFPPFGTVQAGHLQQIAVPTNSGVLGLRIVKVGHLSTECGDDNAVVTVLEGSQAKPTELAAIFGVPYPIKFSTNGIRLVACVAQPAGAPILNFVNIELTVIFDG